MDKKVNMENVTSVDFINFTYVNYVGSNHTPTISWQINSSTEMFVPNAGYNSEPLYRLGLATLLWALPVIITIGTVGNIFSFIVMLQREMRQTSTFFYLAALAVADTAVLFVSAFKTWLRLCSGIEMLHISMFTCKLFTFLTYVSLHLSAWLIVAVTVERFIVVWFPLKATSICSMKRAKLTTMCIAVGFCLLNIHLFWTAELTTDPTSGAKQCGMSTDNWLLYHDILPWVHLALYSFLPFLSLLIFNVLIILSLVKHRQIVASQMTRDDRRTRYNHRRLAVTLLLVSFIWILTTTPSALYNVLPLQATSSSGMAKLFFAKVICFIFLYMNHSINFFLYCITGQTFRRQLVKVVCRACQRRRRPKPRLMFRTSRSGSRQETTFPLMNQSGSKNSSSSTSQSF